MHDAGATGAEVIVVMPDSGLRISHQEFASNNILNPTHLVDGEEATDMTDGLGHGTFVASLVVGKNLGVAPGETLLCITVPPWTSGTPRTRALCQ